MTGTLNTEDYLALRDYYSVPAYYWSGTIVSSVPGGLSVGSVVCETVL